VGSGCNACLDDDPRRASILRFEADGSGETLHASGLRNAVGFDWRPNSDDLFATDNGRDFLGDDLPPCELNQVVKGGFYGWPFAYGNRIPDPDHGRGQEARVAASLPPVHEFPAHSAPLGMTFLRGTRWPPEYEGAALVALHGSWNRSRPDGYKVVSLRWDATGRVSQRDLLWGFLADERVFGRPVDVAEGPDGAVYVSDDYAGSIYRVAFEAGPAAEKAPAPPVPSATPEPTSGEELAARSPRGRALYEARNCARCHETGRTEAGVAVKPLERLATRYSLDDLAALLAAPPAPMPPVELDAEPRKDLAAFLLVEHP
jgi:mono/diheme cytochrome c family protein